MGANTRSYLGAAAITSGIYTILVAYFKPIRDTFEHWLQLVALIANFVTLNVGMLLKIPIDEVSLDSQRERDSNFVSVILVVVNVTVIAVVAGKNLSSMLNVPCIKASDIPTVRVNELNSSYGPLWK